MTGTSLSDDAYLSLASMEGLYEPAVVGKAEAAPKAASGALMGYTAVLLIAAIAYSLYYLPFAPFRIAGDHGYRRPVSPAILAILLGVLVGRVEWIRVATFEQSKRLVRKLLPVLIVLTGAGLNLAQMTSIGLKAFAITVLCILLACGASLYFGRLFGAKPKTAMLIGAGTAICGTSAIVATAPVIGAEDEDITFAVGTVNALGLLLMFCMPVLAGLLRLGDDVFGVWAGTSIHAVPQVVAAAFAYSERAGSLATLVKLVRVTLLAPFLIVLVVVYARREGGARKGYELRLSRIAPPFLWGFLGLAALATLQLIPILHFQLASWVPGRIREFQLPLAELLVEVGNALLTVVMAAMGLELNLRTMSSVGRPALLTGLAACTTLSLFSLLLIRLFL